MGEVDAVGDVVTGTLVAREIDAAGAIGPDGHTHEAACLNCGTPLTGPYCHGCGQHGHVHRTLSAFFHDLLHSVFHFEGRLWKTLPLLAWRPGELTRRYIDGQRARFVSPMALFLFSVFLLFAVLASVGGIDAVDSGEMRTELRTNLQRDEARLAELVAERARAVEQKQPTATLDRRIRSTREEVATLRTMAERGVVSGGVMQVSDDLPQWIRGPVEQANRNPELLFYKLRTNAYKWSWALIPLSVPFLWLLFPFSRRFRVYDHIVFVTYSLCFMSMLVVAGLLFGALGMASAAGLLWLLPPFHMYRQLKGAYGLGRAGALWRTALLLMFAAIVVGLFSAVLVGVGTYD